MTTIKTRIKVKKTPVSGRIAAAKKVPDIDAAKHHVIARLEKMQESLGYNYIHSIDTHLTRILFGSKRAPINYKEQLRSFWQKMIDSNELVADGLGIYCLPNTRPYKGEPILSPKNIVESFWFKNDDGHTANARMACSSGNGERIGYFDGSELRWRATKECYRDYFMNDPLTPEEIILSTKQCRG